jgi:replicative DNA helicase
MINTEASLLSICLKYPDLIPKIRTLVNPKMFADKRYSGIFDTALTLYDNGRPVDPVTVSEEIKINKDIFRGFGDEASIHSSLDEIKATLSTPENFQEYSDIIVRTFRKSYAVSEARKTAEKIKDGADATSVVESLGEKVQEIERASSKPFTSFLELAQQEVGEISSRADKGEVGMDELFVPTPFKTVNRFIYGFRYGSLSLMGARPAMGKTTVGVAMAADAAKRGIKTLFISIEMDKTEIAQKMLSHSSGIHFNKILEGYSFNEGDWAGLSETLGRENETWANNLSIDDKSESTTDVMRSINWGINEGYKYIIIDHLHELAFDKRHSHISLTEAMGDYVKRLRNVAQRNNIAVLALCQLNREVEKRSSKIPLPSDLGESGALERIAHNVILLYRDEVYNRASHHKGELDVVIAKARGGLTGIATLDFDGGTNMVRDQTYSTTN